MTLTSALSRSTISSTRTKGERYFHSHAVVHFDPQQSMAYAVVHGTSDYVVRIEVAGTEVCGTCTCAYFNDVLQPCKHLWAVALTCDARRVVQVPDSVPAHAVVFVPVPLDNEPDPVVWNGSRRGTSLRRPASARGWEQALSSIMAQAGQAPAERPDPLVGQLLYVIDRRASRDARSMVIHLLRRDRKQNGDWGVPKPARLVSSQLSYLPDDDRDILEHVNSGHMTLPSEWGGRDLPSPFYLRGRLGRRWFPDICRTGRALFALTEHPTPRPQDAPLIPLTWLETTFACQLTIVRDEAGQSYRVNGVLAGLDRSIPLGEALLLLDDGLAVTNGAAFQAEPGAVMPWMQQIMQRGELRVPLDKSAHLLDALRASGLPDVAALPGELRITVVDASPVPHLTLRREDEARQMSAEVTFSYEGGPPQRGLETSVAPTHDPQVVARRVSHVERAAIDRLVELGVRQAWDRWERRQMFQVFDTDVPRLVRTLVPEGWRIDADDVRYHVATNPPELSVSSGIDWFEVRGNLTFNGHAVSLPRLLEAVRHRDGVIPLDDGSVGILPEAWLRDLSPLALGTRNNDHLRFRRSQMPLLDALLAARPSVSWDQAAVAARSGLTAIEAIHPVDPPSTFAGTLRDYQREALGWTQFLRTSGFGGCLADDMGLGKTVVVLALLESRRHEREAAGRPAQASLVIVPRSVLFNWQQEAARFAPRLRVLDFSGADRTDRMHLIAESDLVLATYGTQRRDAVALADVEFDYVILDEAQTIKNANTAGAKAVRILRGRHRLALSGTPVENRLADLWSIFDFLNPGLLGGSTAFGRSFPGNSSTEALSVLSRGLRPFILRRTKEQVATELPAKSEQTIVCTLERRQRALYNELRDHYRRQLLERPTSWQPSKMQVLEALLRLRQAACHPALVASQHAAEPSAKLDLLVPRLVETIEEGHKALVFSQFTSFLGLLRTQLEARGLRYEYLDGATRDREARVERFQRDPSCGLFLISLKAGGVGLNLTAADYVFILDPWWNPAAEAQAVDRTHRIGQSRRVFAYRLIAKDTVEERVLELQQRKRELADAVITANNSVVRGLEREDLELLLS